MASSSDDTERSSPKRSSAPTFSESEASDLGVVDPALTFFFASTSDPLSLPCFLFFGASTLESESSFGLGSGEILFDPEGLPVLDLVPDFDLAGLPDLDLAGLPDLDLVGLPDLDLARLPDLDLAGLPDLDFTGVPDLDLERLLEGLPVFDLTDFSDSA